MVGEIGERESSAVSEEIIDRETMLQEAHIAGREGGIKMVAQTFASLPNDLAIELFSATMCVIAVAISKRTCAAYAKEILDVIGSAVDKVERKEARRGN